MGKRGWWDCLRFTILAGLLAVAGAGFGQDSGPAAESSSSAPSRDEVRELREQVRNLREAVAAMRSEAQRYHAETIELRQEIEQIRAASVTRVEPASSAGASVDAASYQVAPTAATPGETQPDQRKTERAASLEEEYQLLSGKVDEQYQTKVESASKYRVRLSGIVLLNLFSNQGTVDSIDLPTLAYDLPPGASGGSFGATLRQSQIGFEVFGPQLAGARTRADLQLDLAGGFSSAPNGVNAGLLRLRTGTMHLDWARTSLVAGQDGLFFSPTSPTSFATLATPALTYAGNLWSWVPQIRVEHRWSVGEDSNLLVQGGIMDPVSGERPRSSYYRQPVAGEQSRQPAYGARVAWMGSLFGQPFHVGFGGYYSRQDYGYGRTVDAWGGMSDWDLPLGRQFSVSGKLYRGRGLGGLYGGIGRSVMFSGDPASPSTEAKGLNSVGGWAQLKYRPASKLEFNGAFGQDNPHVADVRAFPYAQSYGDPTLVRNQGSLVNVIYRPRSDLLFSAEYRYLKTFTVENANYTAGHVNLMMGVLF